MSLNSTARRRVRADGKRTRETILALAADLASLEGLDRLTIGRLAERVGMSKSGLFAHFGSKEELQIAVVEEARQRMADTVIKPALAAPKGLGRLEAVCNGMLSYLERRVFPGGCFFTMVRAEFSARPGPVHDEIVKNKRWIRQFLADLVRDSQANGEIGPAVDPDQLAFELESLWDAPNWSLHDPEGASDIERARRGMADRIALARPSVRR